MMRNTLLGLTAILLICQAQGFSISWPKFGRCPDLTTQQDFDLESYMGKWYSHSTYNVELVQGKGKCSQAEYTLDTSTDEVIVYNKQISLPSGKWVSINGTAVPVDSSKDEGKFTVTFKIEPWLKVNGPYWVLGTDYTSYSVVYGCENFLFFFHYYSSWLLSRSQILNSTELPSFVAMTNAVLGTNKISPSIFQTVNQTDCS